jgi:hypothetical protein
MILATVKNILNIYSNGGLPDVKVFLDSAKIYEDTWAHKIKTLLDEGHTLSVEEEIKLIKFNINLNNKLK